MKTARPLRSFGTLVISDPAQATPLNPAWLELKARPESCHGLDIRMRAMPMGAGRMVSAEFHRPGSLVGLRADHISVLRFGLRGTGRLRLDGRDTSLRTATVVPAGATTSFLSAGCLSLLFQWPTAKLGRVTDWPDSARAFACAEVSEPAGRGLRELAIAGWRQVQWLSPDLLSAYARNFGELLAARWAAAILEQLPAPRRPDPMIGRRKVDDLRAWAGLDRDDPLTVGDLAARCGLGLRALQKNFLRHFDITPGEFLRNLRLEKARKLILSGAFTVTHAALEAGFVHLGHFSANYEKRFGELPSITAARSVREHA